MDKLYIATARIGGRDYPLIFFAPDADSILDAVTRYWPYAVESVRVHPISVDATIHQIASRVRAIQLRGDVTEPDFLKEMVDSV